MTGAINRAARRITSQVLARTSRNSAVLPAFFSFQGAVRSRYTLPARIMDQVASRAREGTKSSHALLAAKVDSAAAVRNSKPSSDNGSPAE